MLVQTRISTTVKQCMYYCAITRARGDVPAYNQPLKTQFNNDLIMTTNIKAWYAWN